MAQRDDGWYNHCHEMCFNDIHMFDGFFKNDPPCTTHECCNSRCRRSPAPEMSDVVVSNLTKTFPTDQSQVNSLEDCCKSTDCCGRLGGMVYGKPCFDRCMKGLNCGFECDRFRATPVGGGPSPQPVL